MSWLTLKSFERSSEARQNLEGRPGRSRNEVMEAEVKKYFVSFMDQSTLQILQDAQHDLLFGPSPDGGAMGFDTATKKLSKWWGQHGYEVWYDRDAGIIYDSKPETEEGSDIVSLASSVAKQYVFGAQLAPYIKHG